MAAHIEPPESLAPPIETATPRAPSAFTRLRRDYALLACLALALLINLALLSYLALRFTALPDLLPLHFDVTGTADRIEAKNGIFALPIIGFIVLLLNTVVSVVMHRRERAATMLLAVSALLVQTLMWFAMVSIVGGFV